MNFHRGGLPFGSVENPKQPKLWSNLKRLMAEKGKTVNELADYLQWGSKESWGKWKRGERGISQPTAIALAKFLRVDIAVLDPSGESFDPEDRGATMRSHARKHGAHGKTPTRDEQEQEATSNMSEWLNNPDVMALVGAFVRLSEEDRQEVLQMTLNRRTAQKRQSLVGNQ